MTFATSIIPIHTPNFTLQKTIKPQEKLQEKREEEKKGKRNLHILKTLQGAETMAPKNL